MQQRKLRGAACHGQGGTGRHSVASAQRFAGSNSDSRNRFKSQFFGPTAAPCPAASLSLVSAERPAILVLRQSHLPRSHASGFSAAVQCCLTPRSSRAPTACHAGPVGGTQYIFASPGLASCRWLRLSSNVRQHKIHCAALQQKMRLRRGLEQFNAA